MSGLVLVKVTFNHGGTDYKCNAFLCRPCKETVSGLKESILSLYEWSDKGLSADDFLLDVVCGHDIVPIEKDRALQCVVDALPPGSSLPVVLRAKECVDVSRIFAPVTAVTKETIPSDSSEIHGVESSLYSDMAKKSGDISAESREECKYESLARPSTAETESMTQIRTEFGTDTSSRIVPKKSVDFDSDEVKHCGGGAVPTTHEYRQAATTGVSSMRAKIDAKAKAPRREERAQITTAASSRSSDGMPFEATDMVTDAMITTMPESNGTDLQNSSGDMDMEPISTETTSPIPSIDDGQVLVTVALPCVGAKTEVHAFAVDFPDSSVSILGDDVKEKFADYLKDDGSDTELMLKSIPFESDESSTELYDSAEFEENIKCHLDSEFSDKPFAIRIEAPSKVPIGVQPVAEGSTSVVAHAQIGGHKHGCGRGAVAQQYSWTRYSSEADNSESSDEKADDDLYEGRTVKPLPIREYCDTVPIPPRHLQVTFIKVKRDDNAVVVLKIKWKPAVFDVSDKKPAIEYMLQVSGEGSKDIKHFVTRKLNLTEIVISVRFPHSVGYAPRSSGSHCKVFKVLATDKKTTVVSSVSSEALILPMPTLANPTAADILRYKLEAPSDLHLAVCKNEEGDKWLLIWKPPSNPMGLVNYAVYVNGGDVPEAIAKQFPYDVTSIADGTVLRVACRCELSNERMITSEKSEPFVVRRPAKDKTTKDTTKQTSLLRPPKKSMYQMMVYKALNGAGMPMKRVSMSTSMNFKAWRKRVLYFAKLCAGTVPETLRFSVKVLNAKGKLVERMPVNFDAQLHSFVENYGTTDMELRAFVGFGPPKSPVIESVVCSSDGVLEVKLWSLSLESMRFPFFVKLSFETTKGPMGQKLRVPVLRGDPVFAIPRLALDRMYKVAVCAQNHFGNSEWSNTVGPLSVVKGTGKLPRKSP